jgi:hypothetical protein
LREERVERDPVFYEPLNEDVGLFVNLNLGTKSCVSHVLLYSPVFLLLLVYLLIELILFTPSSLGLSLEVPILSKKHSNCSLVGRISNSAFHSLALL